MARRRRTARQATAGAFGLVLCVVIGVAAVAGLRRDADHRPQPATSAVVLDPSLRRYLTTIPVLAWGPDAQHSSDQVSESQAFLDAVFAPLSGAHDFSNWPDLRTRFPHAPVGGNAVVLDRSFTKAQLERAAANVRRLPGVKYARVIEVKGLWFTVSASAPVANYPNAPGFIDLRGVIEVVGGKPSGQDKTLRWAQATYVGPPITLATFELMRRRAAEAVHTDLSKVVVKAESAAPPAKPSK